MKSFTHTRHPIKNKNSLRYFYSMETQSKYVWHSGDFPFNLACINNTLHWNSTLHQLAVRAPAANTYVLCNNLQASSGTLKHSYGLYMRSHGLNKLSRPSQAIFLAQKIYIMAFLSTWGAHLV